MPGIVIAGPPNRTPIGFRADWPDVHPEDLDLEIRLESVPTTKVKLLRWLNAYASRFC